MKVIYLAHPLGAPTKEGVAANKARAKRWIRWVYDNFPDIAVVADWLLTVEILDDFNPEHRKHGMAMNMAIIPLLHEFWMVGGRISNGMDDEQLTALNAHRRVVNLTTLGDEPPVDVPDWVKAIVE